MSEGSRNRDLGKWASTPSHINIRQYYDEETRDERASPAKRAGSLHTKQTKP